MALYMTWMDAILLALLLLFAGFLGFFVRRLWVWEVKIQDQLEQLRTETRLADMFSGQGTSENVFALANNLFRTVKQQFKLEATSYTQVIRELEHAHISTDLREALIDFFEHMVLISYKDHEVSGQEREQLKSKIRLIMKKIET
ncbi:MAG: hypothetical protein ACMXYM_00790 [Candidatus Woesearchaeota archaeon]